MDGRGDGEGGAIGGGPSVESDGGLDRTALIVLDLVSLYLLINQTLFVDIMGR